MLEAVYEDEWSYHEKEIMVCMDSKYLRNKHYDLYLVALIQGIAGVEDGEKNATFNMKDARATALTNFGFSPYRFRNCMKAMEEIGFISRTEEKNMFEIEPFAAEGKRFVKVTVGEVHECLLRDLSSFEFKVFLIFRNVQEIKKRKGIRSNFLFSLKGVLEECGYTYAEKNRTRLKYSLEKLEEVNVISYNHKSIFKKGRGKYWALEWAEVRDMNDYGIEDTEMQFLKRDPFYGEWHLD